MKLYMAMSLYLELAEDHNFTVYLIRQSCEYINILMY